MLEILFWVNFVLIFYTYAGYPLLLTCAAAIANRPVQKEPLFPKVSVLISVFNEEKRIEQKILNLLSMDYPEENLEILIGSDGGTDGTDAIVSKFVSPRLRFFRFVKNQGKPSVLNALAREAKGQILVFTDVRQKFDRQAIGALTANFADESVGCVSGELHFQGQETGDRRQGVGNDLAGVSFLASRVSGISDGMGAYWNYEKYLRKKESEIGSMLGATGAIYAIRRKLYETVPENCLVDDMYIPLSIVAKGLRAIFESQAKAYDIASDEGAQEFKRKVRTLVGNYQIFAAFPKLLNPFTSPVGWQLISHKLLRVLVPFFLMALFISSFFLVGNPFYFGIFFAQVIFYGIGILESRKAPGKSKSGIGYLPYTFCLLNFSALVALFRYIRGEYKAAWDKAYE